VDLLHPEQVDLVITDGSERALVMDYEKPLFVTRVDARLSILSVEEREATTAVCVVRCVGGVARVGQRFAIEPHDTPTVTLEEILRYGQSVGFIDPPHSAKVRLTGETVGMLVRRAVVTATADR
jgi:hypothetical protein